MKKAIIVFVVVILLAFSICFVLFRNPSYDLEALAEKFNICYNEIESITNESKLESKFWVTDKSKSLKKGYIAVNDASRIDIEFSTNATATKKGRGTFSLSYTIPEVSDENYFDIGLFVKIINSISGKTTTADFVTEFLTAPEEKYSVEKYGLSGGDYAIEKMHAFNFGEDWVIGYNLTYDNHAELWFYGYIK